MSERVYAEGGGDEAEERRESGGKGAYGDQAVIVLGISAVPVKSSPFRIGREGQENTDNRD